MTPTATKPTLFANETHRLQTGLQILTLAAALSLGAAFVASLWSAPAAAPQPTTAQACSVAPASC